MSRIEEKEKEGEKKEEEEQWFLDQVRDGKGCRVHGGEEVVP